MSPYVLTWWPARFGRVPCAMAGLGPIGANITDRGAVVPTVSWPGLARPSTSLPVLAPQVVDGRHKAGHDAGVTSLAILTACVVVLPHSQEIVGIFPPRHLYRDPVGRI